jgi:hypothetical protein
MKVSSQVLGPDCFTAGETALSIHIRGGLVSPRAALDVMENRGLLPLPGIEPIPLSPFRSLVTTLTELSQFLGDIHVIPNLKYATVTSERIPNYLSRCS